jgi:DNA-binding transcriptional MocR family regulator
MTKKSQHSTGNAQAKTYREVLAVIEKMIADGQLVPGHRLPTHREMSQRLGASIQTVTRAYAEAERMGLVSAQVGRGTFVRNATPERVKGYIADEPDSAVVDLSTITAPSSDLYVQSLRDTFGEISRQGDFDAFLAVRPVAGLMEHRESAVRWLRRAGIETTASHVAITNGASHGLWVAIATVAEPGQTLATETLVDSAVITNASIQNLNLRGIEIDDQGMIPERLAELCRSEPVAAVCVTPTYSNPTVSVMPEARRRQIAELSRQFNFIIIEDDVYGPLAGHEHKPIAHFAPETTIYVTSFSKAISTAFKSGFVVAPERLMSRLTARLRATGWMANVWTAEVARRWLADGTADKLISWLRGEVRKRHQLFATLMEGHAYVWKPYSLHAWLELPSRWTPADLVEEARRKGVLITPPDPFAVDRTRLPNAVRLALGGAVPQQSDLANALTIIGQLLARKPEMQRLHY